MDEHKGQHKASQATNVSCIQKSTDQQVVSLGVNFNIAKKTVRPMQSNQNHQAQKHSFQHYFFSSSFIYFFFSFSLLLLSTGTQQGMIDNLSEVLCFKDQADFHSLEWSRAVGGDQAPAKDRSLPAGGNLRMKLYAQQQENKIAKRRKRKATKRGEKDKSKIIVTQEKL